MIKRTLYFGNPARLRMQQSQLVVEYPDSNESKSVPIEDIGIVIIDHQQVSVTHGLINALIGNNAALLWCDSHHIPNGLVLPMSGNHIFTEKLRYQLDASEPLKKQLWKQTVQAKITNQSRILQLNGKDIENMKYWCNSVGSGDPENYEGRAAAYYWKNIFDENPDFTRRRFGDAPNNLLNYGYALLRAIVARSLVASGCLPALGIFHRNKYNAFCLADDIMEPFRPYVDRLVLSIMEEHEDFDGELTKEIKQKLLQVPVIDIEIEGEKSPLMVGMQRTTASLMKCFEGEARKILYPEL
ncbi:MAG: type II CRISPR-associated endonuclease Cas1 [Flavobacteriales bacterium]